MGWYRKGVQSINEVISDNHRVKDRLSNHVFPMVVSFLVFAAWRIKVGIAQFLLHLCCTFPPLYISDDMGKG